MHIMGSIGIVIGIIIVIAWFAAPLELYSIRSNLDRINKNLEKLCDNIEKKVK